MQSRFMNTKLRLEIGEYWFVSVGYRLLYMTNGRQAELMSDCRNLLSEVWSLHIETDRCYTMY